jgi:heavy metal translocating P-type ATPase
MPETKTKIEIGGMTCAGCASKITSALQRNQDVSSAVIDFATRSGLVEGQISSAAIEDIITSLGYKVLSVGDKAANIPISRGFISPEMSQLMQGGLLAVPVMIVAMGPWQLTYGSWIQLLLATAFIIGPGRGFFVRTVKQLGHGFVTMDTLVAMGVGSAWMMSIVMMILGHHHLYFESAVMIGFFILLGKALEDWARRKSIGEVDRLVRLRPKTLWRKTSGGQLEEVPVTSAVIGDLVYVRPGDMLAVDAQVLDGRASFDESILTGESQPVVKSSGDSVPAGAVNAGATGITLQIVRVGAETAIERIIQLIDSARLSRPPIQVIADKIAGIFVPVVITLSLLTLLYWWVIANRDVPDSLMIALSVLVVACPCALGLATPVAWVAGLGKAAKAGVLVRSYEALETLRRANVIIFDKTGTLTEGRPKVVQWVATKYFQQDRDLGAIISALSHSSHPLSLAVRQRLRSDSPQSFIPLSKLIEDRPGLGAICEIKFDPPKILRFGRPDFVAKELPTEWQALLASGNPVVAVSMEDKPLCIFELKDVVRSDAESYLQKIKSKGFDLFIASGDRSVVVYELVKSLPAISSAHGEMTPSSKKDLVSRLQKEGKVVAFVGDGINDAPALAAADIGIAMGSGTDVAAHSAGLVLQKSGLGEMLSAIDLSSQITKIIKENFFWAFFYNVAAIPVAMLGLVTPMWAALAMALSSVSVVMNALRLRR